MPESRGKKFSELEAGKWLTQTLLFLRGHTKRVSETTSAFLDRVTADWLAASDLSTATRRVYDKLEESGVAEKIPQDTHPSLKADIERCEWAEAEPDHRLFAFFVHCRPKILQTRCTRKLREMQIVQDTAPLEDYRETFEATWDCRDAAELPEATKTHYFCEG